MEFFVLILPVVIVLSLLWICQFTQLMLLSDSDFPGRYDKALWVAAFLLVFALAPIAFYFWKRAYVEMRIAEKDAYGEK